MNWKELELTASKEVLQRCRRILGLDDGESLTEGITKIKLKSAKIEDLETMEPLHEALLGEIRKCKETAGLPAYVTLRQIGRMYKTIRDRNLEKERTIRSQSAEIASLKAALKHTNVLDERAMIDYADYSPEPSDDYRCELAGCLSEIDTPAKWKHDADREEDLPIVDAGSYRGRWICDACYRAAFKLANG